MELHSPKHPIHSRREFLREVGIIVLGVLIALGAEQAVEAVHWRAEVRGAHASLRLEMITANANFAFRTAVRDCVASRLDSLDAITELAARHAPVPHVGTVQPDIANAFLDGDWLAYRASEVLTHFGHPELEEYGGYYGQLEHVRDWIAREHDAWDVIERLHGDPSRLGPDDFAAIRGAIAHARTSNVYIALVAKEEIKRATQLHIPVPPADTARVRSVCTPPSLAAGQAVLRKRGAERA